MSGNKRLPAAAKTFAGASAAATISTEQTAAPVVAAAPAAPAAASNEPAEEAVVTGELIEVRVLSAFDSFEPNDVVALSEEDISALGAAVDADPAAVACAKSLRA